MLFSYYFITSTISSPTTLNRLFACLYMPKAAVSIRLAALAHAGSPQEDVRNFAMNYAMRCFEFISSVQGLSDDDRGICSSELFRAFRRLVDGEKSVAFDAF